MAFATVVPGGVALDARTKRVPAIARAMAVAFVTELVAATLVGPVMTAEPRCAPWELARMGLHFARPMDFAMKNRIVFATAHGLVTIVLKRCVRRIALAVESASAARAIARLVSLVRTAPCTRVSMDVPAMAFARTANASARRVGEVSTARLKFALTTATNVEDVSQEMAVFATLDLVVLIA